MRRVVKTVSLHLYYGILTNDDDEFIIIYTFTKASTHNDMITSLNQQKLPDKFSINSRLLPNACAKFEHDTLRERTHWNRINHVWKDIGYQKPSMGP